MREREKIKEKGTEGKRWRPNSYPFYSFSFNSVDNYYFHSKTTRELLPYVPLTPLSFIAFISLREPYPRYRGAENVQTQELHSCASQLKHVRIYTFSFKLFRCSVWKMHERNFLGYIKCCGQENILRAVRHKSYPRPNHSKYVKNYTFSFKVFRSSVWGMHERNFWSIIIRYWRQQNRLRTVRHKSYVSTNHSGHVEVNVFLQTPLQCLRNGWQ